MAVEEVIPDFPDYEDVEDEEIVPDYSSIEEEREEDTPLPPATEPISESDASYIKNKLKNISNLIKQIKKYFSNEIIFKI